MILNQEHVVIFKILLNFVFDKRCGMVHSFGNWNTLQAVILDSESPQQPPFLPLQALIGLKICKLHSIIGRGISKTI